VCAFPNHVQSTEFTIGVLHSSCRNIKDDQWKKDDLELHFECHGKGCEFLFILFNKSAKISNKREVKSEVL